MISTNASTDILSNGIATQSTNPRLGSSELGQSDFLALMTAQLSAQDPLKPQDNGQFIAQMAQFSSVESLSRLESSFSELANAMSSNQALQASTLVGKEVLVPADMAYVSGDGGASGIAGVTSAVSQATLSITDENGQTIRTISLGQQTGPEVKWEWDGKDEAGNQVAEGVYHINFTGKIKDETTQFPTLVAAQVDSVSLGGVQGVVLNLAGLGPVNLSDVSRING
ncbi:MAG: flagellar biosynthesis protein FlgD [Gammaproteobacteria bacterium CG22_combo_CG10-13_8_21_14_all_40_8]|nr:MAG: flagellar biosynthesis protein FlgD [Gammaproteobacteria bacterium CG22_combo_CG10-13_8_21_14_all_40_8]